MAALFSFLACTPLQIRSSALLPAYRHRVIEASVIQVEISEYLLRG